MPSPSSDWIAIFAEAQRLIDPVARAVYLDRVCGNDAALRGRVEALLDAAGRHLEPDATHDLGSQVSTETPMGAGAPEGATAEPRPADPETGPLPEAPTGSFVGASPLRQSPPGAEPPPGAELGTTIAGRYTLVEAIGEGGMGSVYLASQTEPVRRQVALKLIKSGMNSKAVLARFDAERQALALMDHPNIARIYDGGVTPSGQPFFVMELVRGVPLTAYCDGRRLPLEARLALFVSVCQAVQHAHQKGIIHRDLKPGNVLVTEVDGRPTPKVIDFGVAKATDLKLTEMSFSDVGAIVGTPAYMSPEQADPSSMDIDTRTDVYALGVILYELLTGSPPIDQRQFKRGAILEMLRMVREVEPPRPSTRVNSAGDLSIIASNRNVAPVTLTRLLQGELDWVVMKALEKDRARRYESANGLAQDVQRYLADEVVEARPSSRGYRLQKFVKRNKVQVISAGLVLVALLCGTVGTTLGLFEARRQERAARNQEQRARRETAEKEIARQAEAQRVVERDQANAALKYRLGVGDFLLAVGAYDHGDMVRASELLERVPGTQRGWEWAYLNRQASGGMFSLFGHAEPITSVRCSPDGTRIVTGSFDQTARVWDARTGEQLLKLVGHDSPVRSVSFIPDGDRVVTAGFDGTARVWDVRTGAQLHKLVGHTDIVGSVACSPDGTRIATGGRDQSVRVWDASTGAQLFELRELSSWDSTVRIQFPLVDFSPDGTRLLTGLLFELKVWDARTGMPQQTIKDSNDFQCMCFSADGGRILTGAGNGSLDGTAKIWEAQTGALLREIKGHRGPVVCAVFSPDGGRVVTGGDDRIVRMWDARTGDLLREFRGHDQAVLAVAFSADGARIVSGSHERTLRIWDARVSDAAIDLRTVREAGEGEGTIEAVCFSPDGGQLLTASWGESPRVWDARTGRLLVESKGRDHVLTRFAHYSPDGERFVAGSDGNTALIWNAQSGALLLELEGHTQPIRLARYSPDGGRILTVSYDETAKLWDSRSGAFLLDLSGATRGIQCAMFFPDGERIATGGNDQMVGIWDAKSGTRLSDLRGHLGSVLSIDISREGERIVSGSIDGTAQVWDARTGAPLGSPMKHGRGVKSVCFSPDGTRVATGCDDMLARVWDLRTGTPLIELKGHSGMVHSVSFSPDGTRIVTGATDRTVRLWDAPNTAPRIELVGHTGPVLCASVSADGAHVVTGSTDRTARVWEAATGALVCELIGHRGRVATVGFSSDGTRVVTRDVSDGAERVWDARTGEELDREPVPSVKRGADRADGAFFAHIKGERVVLVPLTLAGTEREYRLRVTGPDDRYYTLGYEQARKANDSVAARFFLDRLIESSTADNELAEVVKWQAERAKYPDAAAELPTPR